MTSQPVSSDAKRTAAFDALRFCAALFVVVYHYGSEAPVDLQYVSPLLARGYLATDFFLMLSGFVLGRAYGRSVEAGSINTVDFFIKRWLRLWPAHAVVMIGLAGLYFACAKAGFNPHHAGRFDARDFLPQLLLVQAWGDVGGAGWNLPSWSLSALLPCYVMFPVIWRGIARARSPWLPTAIIAAVVVAVDMTCRVMLGRGLYDLPFSLGALRAAPIFLLGCALARLSVVKPLADRTAKTAALVAAAGLIGLQYLTRADGLSLALIGVIILGCGSLKPGKSSPAVTAAGKLSFALFITHVPFAVVWFGVIHDLRSGGHAPWLGWTIWGLSLPAALLTAWLFDRFVDQPMQRAIGRLRSIPRPGRYPARTQSA